MDTAKDITVAVVGSRLDYCNSVLYGMPQANINWLQHVQNIFAGVVAWAPWTVSSLDICHDFHWLPVSYHITFKLCLINHPSSIPVWSNRSCSSNTKLLARLSSITLRLFLFSHHPSGTHCLHTSAVLTSYHPSNINWSLTCPVCFYCLVILCQHLRFVSWLWHYMYVCMYACMHACKQNCKLCLWE